LAKVYKMGEPGFKGTMNQAPAGKGQTGGKAGVARSKKMDYANLEPINAANLKFKPRSK
jgi:hypothetical protein